MKFTSNLLRASAAALVLAASALTFGACGDDPVQPGPVTYAPITVFHGVPDYTSSVDFKINGSTIADNVLYSIAPAAQGVVGTATKVDAFSEADAVKPVGSATVEIDSTRSVWVVYSGIIASNPRTDKVFGVSVKKPSVPTGRAVIRALHASSNGPKVDVRVRDVLGSFVAEDLEYQQADSFTSIDTSETTLVVLRSDNDQQLLTVALPQLAAGKIYTVVLYGSASADSTSAAYLKTKVVQEP